MNVLAVVAHFQHLGLVARALALLADQFDVGQELHLDGDRSVALADIAAAAGNVEGKVAGSVTALLALRQGREQLANGIERLDVGHGIRARSAPDGRLIDQHDFVDPIGAFDFVHFARAARR